MNRIPTEARGRRKAFFEADGVDELLAAVLELTAEVSTLRERLYVAERVLEKHGLPLGSEIETYTLNEADEAALGAERQRLLASVMRAFDAPLDVAEQPPSLKASEAA